ncbi:MAG: adenine deaminase [Sphaerochaetaceae bacterium]
MDRKQLKHLIEVAAGRVKADLVIHNCQVVDVFNSTVVQGDVAIADGMVAGIGSYTGIAGTDAKGSYLIPGLIDSHVHIESSLVTPSEFSRLVIPHGTTTVIADPHEICNVCGLEGLDYMLEASRNIPLEVFFMLPSCVPATPFEHSGAVLDASLLATRMDHPCVLGLGELMDFMGTISADGAILDKLMVAFQSGKQVDGHAPALEGLGLTAYAASGVVTDHECATVTELQERVRNGMYVLLREGSACHDLRALLKGVTQANSRRCLMCTDDRQPKSILEEGHIDNHLRIAVAQGLDAVTAVRMATLNAAECFGLKDRGAIAPRYRADLVLVDNLVDFHVQQVWVGGKTVAQGGVYLMESNPMVPPSVSGRMHVRDFDISRLRLPLKSDRVRVIDILPGSVVTGNGTAVVIRDGQGSFAHTKDQDIVKLAVVERHHGTGNIGLALLRGYGIQGGAVATTIAHDSHNIIVAGDNDVDMEYAVHNLIQMGGGITMVAGKEILASLALPIAGLMTADHGDSVVETFERMHAIAREKLHVNRSIDPFMTLSFMALPVIPALKVTDMGLFDVGRFQFVPVELD